MQLPVIRGEIAVPVRLIPVITSNTFGPMTLSGILSNRLRVDGFEPNPTYDGADVITDEDAPIAIEIKASKCFARDVDVYAYHLGQNDMPVKMLSIEWDNIYSDISKLKPVLRKREEKIGVYNSLRPVWQEKTTRILPPGVFLWRHDLDKLWQFHFSFYCKWSGEHPELRILNYDAYVQPGKLSVYLAGFEHMLTGNDANTIRSHKPLDAGKLIHIPRANVEPYPDMEIPLPEEEAQPVKQYPGRLNDKKYEGLSPLEYINQRLQDKPPATESEIVYELNGEMINKKLGELLQKAGRLNQIGNLKCEVSRLFIAEAERQGTADEVVIGRKK